MDDNATFKGDTMIINGDMYADVKFLSTVEFTTKEENPQELIHNNFHYPCILIATASCICNGLDLDGVYRVIHNDLPTSMINCVQEMGTCGRHDVNPVDSKDHFDIFANLQNFVYLNQRLYQDTKDAASEIIMLFGHC